METGRKGGEERKKKKQSEAISIHLSWTERGRNSSIYQGGHSSGNH